MGNTQCGCTHAPTCNKTTTTATTATTATTTVAHGFWTYHNSKLATTEKAPAFSSACKAVVSQFS